MDKCKEGDYLYCEENKERVFLCTKDWSPHPDRKFNRLALIEIGSGDICAYNDDEVYNLNFIIFSESEKKKLEKERKESLSTKIEEDKDILEKVRESLEIIYPNNWDLDISSLNYRSPYTLVIRFPTILNSLRPKPLVVAA